MSLVEKSMSLVVIHTAIVFLPFVMIETAAFMQ